MSVDIMKESGGIILWLQAALGFVGLMVTVERMIYFQHTRGKFADLLLGVTNHVRNKAYAEALHVSSRRRGPEARIVHAVLQRHHLERSNLREIAQEAGQLEVPRIEKNLRVILAVALLAPLLGMFGTVLGLIEVFLNVSSAEGAVAQTALAKGLFQALSSTAMGLAIAIPSYIFYLYLYGKARRLLHRLERAGIETVNIVCDGRSQNHIVSFRDEAEGRTQPEKKSGSKISKKPKNPKKTS
ncbi:MotA/TolQ/ExbB proton channel family protein [Akkermansiaceae bacterium]|nr:MotA/TolQ/ExbB proton channel family protein [Akkermansiaceae bacterium]